MGALKVIHLNTYDGNGGAGRACLRLNKALINQGIDSEVWVGFKFSKDPGVKSFSTGAIKRAATALGILSERYISASATKNLKLPFSIPVWGRDISGHIALQQADIIHIHWINHAFLRPADIEKLAKLNKPIVWTFHDSNMFTGGCHVRFSCNQFENECGNCPILITSGPNDQSHTIWQAKNKAYKSLNISVIAPSLWMRASAGRSSLAGNREVVNIANTIDTKLFRPLSKAEARIKANIAPDVFVILSGFMPSKNDSHKGTSYLLEALRYLKTSIPERKIELVVFGNRDEGNLADFAIKTTFLGTISSDEKLASCYNMADVFITSTLEDNLPNTVMESLSCGTPVVAFATGGIPDMIEHKQNGYLAEYKSSLELSKGIEWVYKHPNIEAIRKNARESVVKNFSEPVIANKHVDLYQQLLPNQEINDSKPVLSIITVVYNDATNIERTILSVLNQTYANIEYIVIDGFSSDNTLSIIKRYESKIAKVICEKDSGIYDAMNKGLGFATGEYVLFMNSGDEIYAPDTVARIFAFQKDADIYYGETEMIDKNLHSLGQRRHMAPVNLSYTSFRFGMSVSHQAIYIRRALVEPFDTHYKLSSDIDWILKAVKKAKKIVNTKLYVAKYLVGGISKAKHKQSLLERFEIFNRHYGIVPNLLNHAVIAVNLGWYYLANKRTND